MAKPKQPVEKPFLFVDLSNLVYKNASSLHFLRTKDGTPTGGIYGTIRNLLTWSKKFRVWVFADGRGGHRKALLSNYKAGRTDSNLGGGAKPVPQVAADPLEAEVVADMSPTFESLKSVVYSNIDALVRFLPDFGFPVIAHPEWEADDLIGAAVFLRERGIKTLTLPEIYVISTDKDFDQLPVHRLSTLKAHAAIATGKSPINDTFLLGAGTLANFSEIPQDALLRQNPHWLILYRAITGDTSDRIKGLYTPTKLWKKRSDGLYFGDDLIQSIVNALPNPGTSYTGLAWSLDQALNYGGDIGTPLRASGLWSVEQLDKLLVNLKITKIPFDLVKVSSDTIIKVNHKNTTFEAPLAFFFLTNQLPPDFVGWYKKPGVVEEVCNIYQMPSLIEKFNELEIVTQSHFLTTTSNVTSLP